MATGSRTRPCEDGPIPSATDSALVAARGGSDRITARASSAARFGTPERAATELTFTAEHSAVREESSIVTASVTQSGGTADAPRLTETVTQGEARLIGWRGNTGLVAQSTTALRNRLFVTAGLRLERNDALIGSTRVTPLPMIGGAIVGDRGDVTLKLRAAYGKGIRPVQGAIRELAMERPSHGTRRLRPDTGAAGGRRGGRGPVRGSQPRLPRDALRSAGDGSDSVGGGHDASAIVVARCAIRRRAPSDTYVAYQLQNVGEISNRGWELQSSADLGRLSLTGTLSLVDSRVQRLASGYSGDLRAGDRMLEVPSHTTSLSGSWTGRGWFTSLTVRARLTGPDTIGWRWRTP